MREHCSLSGRGEWLYRKHLLVTAIPDANAPDMFNNSRMVWQSLIQLVRDLA
jgi:hypothetical protein